MGNVQIDKTKIVIPSLIDDGELEGKIGQINEKNKKFAEQISRLISDYHFKIALHTQKKTFNLMRFLMYKSSYDQIFKAIKEGTIPQNIKQLIRTSLLKNKTYTEREKKEIQQFLTESLETQEIQNELKKKIVESDVKSDNVNGDRSNHTNSILFGVLSNKNVLKGITNHIIQFQTKLNGEHKTNLLRQIRNINDTLRKSKSDDRNDRISRMEGRVGESVRDMQSVERKRHIRTYNKFLIGVFVLKIKDISGTKTDKIVRNVISNNIHRKVLKFTNIVNPRKTFRQFKRLTTARFWKKTGKKILSSVGKGIGGILIGIMKLPWIMTKGFLKLSFSAEKGAFGLLKFAASSVPKVIIGTLNMTFGLIGGICGFVSGSFGLIKNILKLSVNILKSSMRIGYGFLKRIKLFLFSPIGMYIMGFVVGFFYEMFKAKIEKIINGLNNFYENPEEWLNEKYDKAYAKVKEKDQKWQEKHPKYREFREYVDKKIQEFEKFKNEKEQEIHKLNDDIKELAKVDNPYDEDRLVNEIKGDIQAITGTENLVQNITDALMYVSDLAERFNSVEGQKFMDTVKKISRDITDMRNYVGEHGGIARTSAAKASNYGARMLCGIIGGIIGSAITPGVGTIIGTGIGGFVGSILGNMIEGWISNIPYVKELQKNRWRQKAIRVTSKPREGLKLSNAMLIDQDFKLKQLRELSERIARNETQGSNSRQMTEQERDRAIDELHKMRNEYLERYGYDSDQLTDSYNISNRIQMMQNRMDSELYESVMLSSPKGIADYILTGNVDTLRHGKMKLGKWGIEAGRYRFEYIQKIIESLNLDYMYGIINKEEFHKQLQRYIKLADDNTYVRYHNIVNQAIKYKGVLDQPGGIEYSGNMNIIDFMMNTIGFSDRTGNVVVELSNSKKTEHFKYGKQITEQSDYWKLYQPQQNTQTEPQINIGSGYLHGIEYDNLTLNNDGKIVDKITNKVLDGLQYSIDEFGNVVDSTSKYVLIPYVKLNWKIVELGGKFWWEFAGRRIAQVSVETISTWSAWFGEKWTDAWNGSKGILKDAYRNFKHELYVNNLYDSIDRDENGIIARQKKLSEFSQGLIGFAKQVGEVYATKEQQQKQRQQFIKYLKENGNPEQYLEQMAQFLDEDIYDMRMMNYVLQNQINVLKNKDELIDQMPKPKQNVKVVDSTKTKEDGTSASESKSNQDDETGK